MMSDDMKSSRPETATDDEPISPEERLFARQFFEEHVWRGAFAEHPPDGVGALVRLLRKVRRIALEERRPTATATAYCETCGEPNHKCACPSCDNCGEASAKLCVPCVRQQIEEAVDSYIDDKGHGHCQGCVRAGVKKCPGVEDPRRERATDPDAMQRILDMDPRAQALIVGTELHKVEPKRAVVDAEKVALRTERDLLRAVAGAARAVDRTWMPEKLWEALAAWEAWREAER